MTLWSKEEREWLDLYCNDLPPQELICQFRKRWPHRSEKAIRSMVLKHHGSILAFNGHWLHCRAVAAILGVSDDRVRKWLQKTELRECLQLQRWGKGLYGHRKDWRRLARKHPEVFGGIERDRLFALLEDENLAADISRRFPGDGRDFRIRCIETGQIWSSCRHAANELFVNDRTIALAIRENRPVYVLGMTFETLRAPSLP